ncbi:PaaI family thioesterase [Pseudoprimorskyibacter insulae]|uniref:Thioesterase domain-containing protein n=1 Tax=Pseudoprimorskyibacter insulae TaxID=1695997 RepID=A0A2R8AV58_9RHOB|nr:PaaI family thioesterase [Pseudoprimorskyibacter insulae]SPF79890.1 hypothetical protein PRI8871_01691 [Pseudoprimorskyibacter insulae]
MVEVAEQVSVLDFGRVAKMTGLEVFQAMMAGEMLPPPLSAQIPMAMTEVSEGRVVWTTRAPEWFINPMGQVHGGFAMTLIDSACGCAVHSALPAGKAYTTIETKVNMTRAAPRGEDMRAEGVLITMGSRVATSEAKIYDQKGRVVAFGTSTCLVFDM